MKKLLSTSLILALALAFALSAPALAQDRTTQGKIDAVDAKAKSFTVSVGTSPMTFNWHKTTKIMEFGHKVKASALVTGANVIVKYYQRDGKNVANEITIIPTQAPSKQK